MGLLVRVALAVAANAVALLLAAILLDGVEIAAGSFVAAVAVFSVASLVVRPLVAWGVVRYASALGGAVALAVSAGLQRRVVGMLRPRSGAS